MREFHRISTFFALIASVPIIIIFTPKPELKTFFPPDMFCATCAEIDAHNPQMLETSIGGQHIGCRALLSSPPGVPVDRRIYVGMRRCWYQEIDPTGRELDTWLKPVGWSRSDVVKWMEQNGMKVDKSSYWDDIVDDGE